MNTKVLFSSKKHDWETPLEFFKELDKEFCFSLDPCATESTSKCARFYTKEQDGLTKSWAGENVYVNPPYGREIGKWVKKAHQEFHSNIFLGRLITTKIIMLIPARTDTKWFHEYIYNKPHVEVRFLKGRIKFKGAKHAAPFPSMLVIWR